MVWKFRYYLSREKKALTKFLKCVFWNDEQEGRQAVELMGMWADVDVEDSLELLSSSFLHASVRAHAVKQLAKADDEVGPLHRFSLISPTQELQLFLLQLVQALKYERVTGVSLESSTSSGLLLQEDPSNSPLVTFLVDRATKNESLAIFLYWYISVEMLDPEHGKWYTTISSFFMNQLLAVCGSKGSAMSHRCRAKTVGRSVKFSRSKLN